jgi:hypothetical protein
MFGIIKTTTAAAVLVVGALATPALLAQTSTVPQMPGSETMPLGQEQMMPQGGTLDQNGMFGQFGMMRMMMQMMHNVGAAENMMGQNVSTVSNMMGQINIDAMKNFVGAMTYEQRQLMLEMLQENGTVVTESE